MDNLIAGYSGKAADAKSYSFDVVVSPVDVAVHVDGKLSQSFTKQQVVQLKTLVDFIIQFSVFYYSFLILLDLVCLIVKRCRSRLCRRRYTNFFD